MSHVLADLSTARPIRSVAEARSYIAGVCFKHGPPRRTGIELEWLLVDPADPLRRPDRATLLDALGEHAPRTLDPASACLPLPAGGVVTVEPGGQLEISSAPARSVAALVTAMRCDIAALRSLLEPTGFELSERAVAPQLAGHRLLSTPRYDAMAAGFDRLGPAGRTMMCATAATQICVDLGEPDQAEHRWHAAHQLGPVLLAAFANSAADDAASARMAAWWELDPARTAPPQGRRLAEYLTRALDTQVLARQRGDADWLVRERLTLRDWLLSGDLVTTCDIDLHLSMLFPPVRPQGYLEVRYLDAQPGDGWLAPLVLLAGLFADRRSLAQALEICAPVADRWQQATRSGLQDPALGRAAGQLAELCARVLDPLGLPAADRERAVAQLHERLTGRSRRPTAEPAGAARHLLAQESR